MSLWSRIKRWFVRKPKATPISPTPTKPPEAPNKPTTPSNPPTVMVDVFLRNELIKLVAKDIGQRETTGKNRSPLIDMINSSCPGAYIGAPYCISGLLVRGVKKLCNTYGLANPVKMTASTQEFYDATPAKFKHAKGSLGHKGDIGIQQSKSNPDTGHAYILEEDEASTSGLQHTIEYNTDGSGGRDGDGVYRRTRSQSGDLLKRYRGSVDVIAWILSANPNFKAQP